LRPPVVKPECDTTCRKATLNRRWASPSCGMEVLRQLNRAGQARPTGIYARTQVTPLNSLVAASRIGATGGCRLRRSCQFESLDKLGEPEPNTAHFFQNGLRLRFLRLFGEFQADSRMRPVRLGLRLHCPAPYCEVSPGSQTRSTELRSGNLGHSMNKFSALCAF
jgi:hypothetical protein